MKLYTHWTESPAGDLKRTFFGRKSHQMAAARDARKSGFKVLGEGEYHLEPTADAVAEFINEHTPVTSQDLVEEFLLAKHEDAIVDGAHAAPSLEDMLS